MGREQEVTAEKRGNERESERSRVTGKGWVVREGKAKP